MDRVAALILLLAVVEALHLTVPRHQMASVIHNTLPAELFMQHEFLALRSKADYVSRVAQGSADGLSKLAQQSETTIDQLKEVLTAEGQNIYHGQTSCPPILSFNRSHIGAAIAAVETSNQRMVDYLPGCQGCPGDAVEATYEIQNMTYNYTGYVNQTLNGEFCGESELKETPSGLVDINNSYFKNNLRAPNWYYGSTTGSDYKLAMFKKAATFNLTDCPLSAPFVKPNEQICFDCPSDSIFNLGSHSCDSCPPGRILNVHTSTCDVCLGERKFLGGKLQCQPCKLSDGQLFNQTSGKCYTCGRGTYLDEAEKKCKEIKCPLTDPHFNPEMKKCESCPDSEMVDPYDITRCVKTNYIGLCPPSAPLYDYELRKCVPKSNQTSVAVTHAQAVNPKHSEGCSDEKPWRNPENNECEACNVTHHFDAGAQLCLRTCAPALKLNRTADKCVSRCERGFTFEVKAQRCVPTSMVCSQEQFYDSAKAECVAISSTCRVDQKYQAHIRLCVAVESTCRWDERYDSDHHVCEKMVLCKEDEMYNHNLSICEKKNQKCTEEEYFDGKLGKCVRYQFITSPYVGNLLYKAQFKNYISFYEKKKDGNAKLRDCPVETPYYSTPDKQCVTCPKENPLFDLTYNYCTSCHQSHAYDIALKSCLPRQPETNSDILDRIDI